MRSKNILQQNTYQHYKAAKVMNLKNLKPNDLLVMPRFGVGKCKDWQVIEIDGCKAKMLSIYFYTSKVTIHFPKEKIDKVKARALASLAEITRVAFKEW
jgi:RNA polymerase-interacting CarD/CdnL/TRCF family regulator